MSLVRDVIDSVLFPNKEMHAIPVLDGAFSPNSRLDRSRALGEAIVRPDDFVLGPDGALYVSSETTVLRCSGADYTERSVFARLPGMVGALAWTRDDRLLAGVSGLGIVALSLEGREVNRLGDAAGARIECPTAVTVADDGKVYLCDGSRSNRPEDWLPDLMQRRPPSGRLIACAADLTGARVIADGLDWPNGVAMSHDGRDVLTT
jgi:hypothetical protein